MILKIRKILFYFFVYSNIIMLPSCNRNSSEGPKLEVQNSIIDLGYVIPRYKIVQFNLKNVGNQELAILAVKPSCGCTIVKDFPQKILPKESGIIQIKMDRSGLTGLMSKDILVFTNDPRLPKKLCTIKFFSPYVFSLPDRIKCEENIDEPKIIKENVQISNHGYGELYIKSWKTSSPNIKVSLKDCIFKNKYPLNENILTNLIVEIDTHLYASGTHSEYINFLIEHKDNDITYNLPIDIKVLPHVLVAPSAILFGKVELSFGKKIVKEVFVFSYKKGEVIEIASVKCDSKEIVINYNKKEDGYKLSAYIQSSQKHGKISTYILIQTKLPNNNQIKIPVLAYW